MPRDDQQPLDTVRLNKQKKQQLLDAMDEASRAATNPEADSRLMRVDYRQEMVTVSIIHPNGSFSSYAVTPRNLSARGVGFLHGTFVYPNSRCTVELVDLNQQTVKIDGEIASCRHVTGQVHEIGVCFDNAIDLRQFVSLDADACRHSHHELDSLQNADAKTASIDDLQLTGRVLLVDESAASRKVLTHWLSRMGLVVIEAYDTDDAWERIRSQSFNLLVVDVPPEDPTGFEIITQIRKAGRNAVRIIVTSSEDSGQTAADAETAGADAFLSKPIEMGTLHTTLEDLLVNNNTARYANEPIRSSFAGDPDMEALLEEFVGSLDDQVDDIGSALDGQDLKTVMRVCRDLKGSGGSYGFHPVSDAAAKVIETLQTEPTDLEEIHRQVETLNQIIDRVILD